MRKPLVLLIISISVISVGIVALSAQNPTSEPSAQVQAEQKTNLVTLESGTNTYTQIFVEAETAEAFLSRLQSASKGFTFEITNFEFGAFVVAINGMSAGKNEFWEFKVNGKQSDKGISDYIIKPGDKLEFILTKI